MHDPAAIRFDNTWARELPAACVPWQPAKWPAPRELWFNRDLAQELGLPLIDWDAERRAAFCGGQVLEPGAQPVAQAYAGHQFGGFSPQLGDGRALLLGEVVDNQGQRRDLALKGSGRTPFSRGGDGKAAVGPMLREVIIGEAMHALGVPTTRALAVVATGEPVMRDRVLPGAVLMRVAASHLRVGSFEFFAARGDTENLERLLAYAVRRHDPDLLDSPQRAAAFLRAVALRQAELVAQWMNLGFIHGVMNTDNMTISGETIDYGPCAFMEAYDPQTVFSSIDHQGRYAYGRQPAMAQWNLARLAEALLPLIDVDPDRAVQQAQEALQPFAQAYGQALLRGRRAKLGLTAAGALPDDAADEALIGEWLAILQATSVDHTLAWRHLADAAQGHDGWLLGLMADHADGQARLQAWLGRWRERLGPQADGGQSLARRMRLVNPAVIPRNHEVESALSAAMDHHDLGPLHALLDAVRQPWDEAAMATRYARPASPAQCAGYRTFCGT